MGKVIKLIKKYGMSGFSKLALLRFFEKLTGFKIRYSRYYIFDLNEEIPAVKDNLFKRLSLSDFSLAGTSDLDNAWFTSEKMAIINHSICSPSQTCYGIYQNNKLANYGFLNQDMDGHQLKNLKLGPIDAYLWDDYTHPSFRGKGFHTQSIFYRLGKAKDLNKRFVWSNVLIFNSPSFHNYIEAGFKPVFDIVSYKDRRGKKRSFIPWINKKLWKEIINKRIMAIV